MTQAADPFEMIRNFWANVPGMGGAGMSAPQMPSFDPKELEKRLAELKQVKQWLEMNLNMLNLQVNTMEMQLAAFKGFKNAPGMPEQAEEKSDMAEAAGAAAGAASNAGAEAIAQGAQALQAMPWANPGEWLKSMQAVFKQPVAPVRGAKKAAANSARTAAAKPAARKSPAKRPRAKR